MASALVVVLLAASLLVSCVHAQANFAANRPIIGIMTLPTSDGIHSYIAASYVKYLEGAGARVVPVFHNSTFDELDAIFESTNGLLLTGGATDLNHTSPVFISAQYLYRRSLKTFAQGDQWPIVGHCLGFELLSLITADTDILIRGLDAENISLALTMTPLSSSSRMFGEAPPEIIDYLTRLPTTMNNHGNGVTPSTAASNPLLSAFYNVLSTNVDRQGTAFVSSMEAKQFPIYAVQWHPEKNPYEWDITEGINHSYEAVLVSNYMANFFVAQARASSHHFPSQLAEHQALIYNYNPKFASDQSPFMQVYTF